MNKKFEDNLSKFGISLTTEQSQQFEEYYEMLIEWNKVMNLTGITEYEEVFMKHFTDSLSIVKFLNLEGDIKVIDIGTGAGFPGIPLKIIFPNLDIVLLDSLAKRIKFLETVKSKLGLTKIDLIHGRAEDYARKIEYREYFDLCVSRAVSHLSTLSEYCIPFIRVGGTFVSYKGDEIDKEIEESKIAIDLLGSKIEKIEKFELLDTNIKRSFVLVKKNINTPEKYPRKSGIPEKRPL